MGSVYADYVSAERRTGERTWVEQAPFSEHTQKAIDKLHRNVFCSPVRFESFGNSAFAYINADEHHIKQIILFSQQKRLLTVLNEMFSISKTDIEKFISYIFATVPEVEVIRFPSISQRTGSLAYPYQSHNSTEDIVIRLACTPKAYVSELGKNMRESIRRYQKRIARELNGIEFKYYEAREANVEKIRELVRLSKARMLKKNAVPTHTRQTTEQLERIVSKYGVTMIATLDDAIVAGVICTQVEKNFFMHVLSHDPTYDSLRLGKVCCYLSICDAIERGAEEYHMLSGEYEYKYRFLGERRDYERLTVYRSRTAIFKNLEEYLRSEIRGRGRRVKKYLKAWRRQWNQ